MFHKFLGVTSLVIGFMCPYIHRFHKSLAFTFTYVTSFMSLWVSQVFGYYSFGMQKFTNYGRVFCCCRRTLMYVR